MSDVTANHGMHPDFIAFLGIFIHYRERRSLMHEVLYRHQNFTDCVELILKIHVTTLWGYLLILKK